MYEKFSLNIDTQYSEKENLQFVRVEISELMKRILWDINASLAPLDADIDEDIMNTLRNGVVSCIMATISQKFDVAYQIQTEYNEDIIENEF